MIHLLLNLNATTRWVPQELQRAYQQVRAGGFWAAETPRFSEAEIGTFPRMKIDRWGWAKPLDIFMIGNQI
jgi:hypothetical protein